MTATLHIEHPITDLETWRSAFDRFADARRRAGVRAHRIQRAVDDPLHLVIDLDFDTPEEAQGFLQLLRTRVWGIAANSPALAGDPTTLVLEAVPERPAVRVPAG